MEKQDLARVRRRLRKARTTTVEKWERERSGIKRQFLAGVVEGIDYAGRVLTRRGRSR